MSGRVLSGLGALGKAIMEILGPAAGLSSPCKDPSLCLLEILTSTPASASLRHLSAGAPSSS